MDKKRRSLAPLFSPLDYSTNLDTIGGSALFPYLRDCAIILGLSSRDLAIQFRPPMMYKVEFELTRFEDDTLLPCLR